MSKKETNKIIPKIRFPEFINADHWFETTLGESLLTHPEYGLNAAAVPYNENLPAYLRITDISEAGYFIRNNKMSVAENVTEDNYLQEGEIVLARTGASVGKSYKYRIDDGRLVFAGFLIRVKPDPKKLNSDLLFQFLSTDQYWRWVAYSSARSGQPGINGNEYASMPLPLPPTIQEQQKIADCLSSLDDLISANIEKLETLKSHKKGLMQQLFPAEGETVPKLRFEEFRGDGDWEEKKLEECLKQHPEYGINAAAVPYSSSLPTYLRITDISEDGVFLKDNKVSVKKEVTRNNYLEVGDIVLARTGASVGKPYKYRAEDGELVFAGFLIRVKPNASKLNSELLYQFLCTDKYWRWVNLTSARSGQPGINGNEYALLPIKLPPLINEQHKIAECLSSLDELITTQTEKIKALQKHKKGLMEGLFPDFNKQANI